MFEPENKCGQSYLFGNSILAKDMQVRGGQLDAGTQKDESFLSHPSRSNTKYGRTGMQAVLHKHKEEAEGRWETRSQCGDSIIRNLSLAYAPYLQAVHLWM